MSEEECSYNLDGDITKAASDLLLGSRVCPRGQEEGWKVVQSGQFVPALLWTSTRVEEC